MTFTDDDIERLKFSGTTFYIQTVNSKVLDALLARLEAAEKVCEMTYKNLGMYSETKELPREIVESIEAWRTVCGK
jgi:hypothetical protein